MKRMSNIISLRKPEKKMKRFAGAVFALMLAVFILPTNTLAGDTLQIRGQNAEAFFFSIDASECIETTVFVFASEEAAKRHDSPGPPGPTDFFSFASIGIFQVDVCKRRIQFLLDAFCSVFPLANEDFQVNKMLDSAMLNATLECFDNVSSSFFNVDADLDWTATGDPVRESFHFHFLSPGFSFNFRSSSTSRTAEVSGMVSRGATNFTPVMGSGAIRSTKLGEV